jgi:hypothetical protein
MLMNYSTALLQPVDTSFVSLLPLTERLNEMYEPLEAYFINQSKCLTLILDIFQNKHSYFCCAIRYFYEGRQSTSVFEVGNEPTTSTTSWGEGGGRRRKWLRDQRSFCFLFWWRGAICFEHVNEPLPTPLHSFSSLFLSSQSVSRVFFPKIWSPVLFSDVYLITHRLVITMGSELIESRVW